MDVIRSFLKDLGGWWKHKFLKKGNLSCEEKNLAYFSSKIDCEKPQGTIHEVPKGSLAITLEDIRSFLHNIGWWKQKLLRKKAIFPVKKRFRYFFLELSSVTNPKGQLMTVHKVFWQILWKLDDHFWNT